MKRRVAHPQLPTDQARRIFLCRSRSRAAQNPLSVRLRPEDGAADVALLAFGGEISRSSRAAGLLDREMRVADLPGFSLAPDRDPAAAPVLVIAVAQFDDIPPGRPQ